MCIRDRCRDQLIRPARQLLLERRARSRSGANPVMFRKGAGRSLSARPASSPSARWDWGKPGREPISGERKPVGQSAEVVAGQRKLVPASGEVVAGQRKLVRQSAEVTSGGRKLVPASGEAISGERKLVPASGQVVAGEQKLVPDFPDPFSGEGKMLPELPVRLAVGSFAFLGLSFPSLATFRLPHRLTLHCGSAFLRSAMPASLMPFP